MATTKTTAKRRSNALAHVRAARRILATIKADPDSEHRGEMADMAINAADVLTEEINMTTKRESTKVWRI